MKWKSFGLSSSHSTLSILYSRFSTLVSTVLSSYLLTRLLEMLGKRIKEPTIPTNRTKVTSNEAIVQHIYLFTFFILSLLVLWKKKLRVRCRKIDVQDALMGFRHRANKKTSVIVWWNKKKKLLYLHFFFFCYKVYIVLFN